MKGRAWQPAGEVIAIDHPPVPAGVSGIPLAMSARYAYNRIVAFEWDPAKSAATEQSRGIDFARAAEIFSGRLVEWSDHRHPYGQARIRAVGISNGILLHLVYTRRGAVIRITSARRANQKERAQWLSSA